MDVEGVFETISYLGGYLRPLYKVLKPEVTSSSWTSIAIDVAFYHKSEQFVILDTHNMAEMKCLSLLY